MVCGLLKNTLRKVKKSFLRFLCVLLIVAVGSAFFSGLVSSSGYLKNSADDFLNSSNVADFHLLSTVGFSESDLDKVKSFDNVLDAVGSYSICLAYKRDTENVVCSVCSYDEQSSLNTLTLTEGRLPEKPGECLADYNAYKCGDFYLGESVTLYSDEDFSDVLGNNTYTVVGLVHSPLSLSYERGSTTSFDGTVNAFLYVPKENFVSSRYTDIYVKMTSLENVNAFGDEYGEISDSCLSSLEEFSESLTAISASELKSSLISELEENKKKLSDAKDEYEIGKKTYDEAVKSLETGEKELSEKKTELREKTAEYESSLEAFEASENKLSNLLEATSSVDTLLERYSALFARKIPDDVLKTINSIKSSFDEFSGENLSSETLGANMANLLSMYILSDDFAEKENLSLQITSLSDMMKQSAANAAKELETASASLSEAESAINTANETISEYEEELSSSREKLSQTADDLQNAKDEIDSAESELQNAENEISEKTDNASCYVFSRDDFIPGFSDYKPDCERVYNVALVFPVFFVLLAALVCICTMTRMVEEERTEAGVLSALGVSTGDITLCYVLYAVCASVLGSAFGVYAGTKFIPSAIYSAYSSMYDIPNFSAPFNISYLIGCMGVSCACTIFSTVFVCMKSLSENPAALMLPRVGVSGRKIFLEKFPKLWNKLGFMTKVTLRNLFRRKSRFFLGMFGTLGSTALLFAGFTLDYDISAIADKQFGEIMKYDCAIAVDSEGENLGEFYSFLSSSKDVESFAVTYMTSASVTSENGEECDVTVVAFDDISVSSEFIGVRDRKTGENLQIPIQGAIITEKMSKLLSVNVNDTINIGENECKVCFLCENYVGNYVYVTKETAEAITGESGTQTVLLKLSDGCVRENFSEECLKNDDVLGITFVTSLTEKFSALTESFKLVVLLITLFSGALCFIILMCLSAINLSERSEELKTLKVLGFYDIEVSGYLFRENIISYISGIILGLFAGIGLLRVVVYFGENQSVMFVREYPVYCFLLSAGICAFFALTVECGGKKID